MPAGAAAPSFDDVTEIEAKYASSTSAVAAVGQVKLLSVGVKYTFRHS